MSVAMTEFHATRMGHRFFEHTVPELVRQRARLNDNLERLSRVPTQRRIEDDDDQDEEAGDSAQRRAAHR